MGTRIFGILTICLAIWLGASSTVLAASTLTTIVVREKAGVSTSRYPLTFGLVFKKGDVPQSVAVSVGATVLPTQVDVKGRYPDGSVRHAVISVLLPKISANEDLALTVLSSSTQNRSPEMTKTEILATDLGAVINLAGLSGSNYSGDLTANLREAITATQSLNYWLRGDVCSEILVTQNLNKSLNASWEVRLYPGTPYIRISHAIENVNWQSRGNVSYALKISQGRAAPVQVYSKDTFQHNHSSRWRKVFWLGSVPPEVEIRYDLPYLVSTGMVMPYDVSLKIPETALATHYRSWAASKRDLMENGLIYQDFGTTGGRPEIGILPKWSALYLLTMDNRMREIVIGSGEISGHIPIHYREDDPTKSFYGHTVSIDDRPIFDILGNTKLPYVGTLTTSWAPDRAHQGSFAYLPYLITGDKWFKDELFYWGGWNLIYDEYMRNGNGSAQNFSYGKTAAFGSLYDQLRGLAWALRNVSDAAVAASETDPEKTYFTSKVKNNLDWLTWGNSPGATSHGLNAVRHQREQTDAAWPTKTVAPWQHDFLVLVLSDIVRKETVPASVVSSLRDRLGKFTIGRFTNEPAFPRFEGAGYWWPLADRVGNYYSDGDWSRYWIDVATYSKKNPLTPATSFATLNYAYSYAAIALGTTAFLTHLPNGLNAYNFLKTNLSYSVWALDDPTWAFNVITPPKKLKVGN